MPKKRTVEANVTYISHIWFKLTLDKENLRIAIIMGIQFLDFIVLLCIGM